MIRKTLIRLTWILALWYPSSCNGIFFSGVQCRSRTTRRCGFLGLLRLQRKGIPGTESCQEFCMFFVSPDLDCGGCDGDDLLPSSAPNPVRTPVSPPKQIPVLVPKSNPIPRPVPVTRPAPIPRPVTRPVATPKIAPTPAPITPPITPNTYNIALSLVGVTGTDRNYFTNAASRWQSIIRSDLTDASTAHLDRPSSGCTYPSTIDDLYICAAFVDIDGPGNVLGSSGPIYVRSSNGLTLTGDMTSDTDDISNLKSAGNFGSVILHEMGHILGIGTLWEQQGVSGPDSSNCPYRGARANAEYKSLTGCNIVPTENDGRSNDGTFCSHWDEECLKSELMTGYLNSGLNPLSRISIASLEDLGYTVDYSSAESYTRNDVLSSCRCGQRSLLDNHTTKRRSLSTEAYEMAVEYGQSILSARKPPASSLIFSDALKALSDDVVYVGDRAVMVFVEDGGVLFDVLVRPLT